MTKLQDLADQSEDFWFDEMGDATAGTYYAGGTGSGESVDFILTSREFRWEQTEDGRDYIETRTVHVKRSDIATPETGVDTFKFGSDIFLIDDVGRQGPLWRFQISRTVRSERSSGEIRTHT